MEKPSDSQNKKETKLVEQALTPEQLEVANMLAGDLSVLPTPEIDKQPEMLPNEQRIIDVVRGMREAEDDGSAMEALAKYAKVESISLEDIKKGAHIIYGDEAADINLEDDLDRSPDANALMALVALPAKILDASPDDPSVTPFNQALAEEFVASAVGGYNELTSYLLRKEVMSAFTPEQHRKISRAIIGSGDIKLMRESLSALDDEQQRSVMDGVVSDTKLFNKFDYLKCLSDEVRPEYELKFVEELSFNELKSKVSSFSDEAQKRFSVIKGCYLNMANHEADFPIEQQELVLQRATRGDHGVNLAGDNESVSYHNTNYVAGERKRFDDEIWAKYEDGFLLAMQENIRGIWFDKFSAEALAPYEKEIAEIIDPDDFLGGIEKFSPETQAKKLAEMTVEHAVSILERAERINPAAWQSIETGLFDTLLEISAHKTLDNFEKFSQPVRQANEHRLIELLADDPDVIARNMNKLKSLENVLFEVRRQIMNGKDADYERFSHDFYAQLAFSNLAGRKVNYGDSSFTKIKEKVMYRLERAGRISELDDVYQQNQLSQVYQLPTRYDILRNIAANDVENQELRKSIVVPGAELAYDNLRDNLNKVTELLDADDGLNEIAFEQKIEDLRTRIDMAINSARVSLLENFGRDLSQPKAEFSEVKAGLDMERLIDIYTKKTEQGEKRPNEAALKAIYDGLYRDIASYENFSQEISDAITDESGLDKLNNLFRLSEANDSLFIRYLGNKKIRGNDEISNIMRQLAIAQAARDQQIVENEVGPIDLGALSERSGATAADHEFGLADGIIETAALRLLPSIDRDDHRGKSASLLGAWNSLMTAQPIVDTKRRLDENKKVGASAQIQFMATRGLGLEFSGVISDACWADNYPSIAEAMPNLTGVLIKENAGVEAAEKLAGAFMLIETNDVDTGEPTLVIRGLNPKETLINSLDTKAFFGAAVDYAKQIARAKGAKVAVVVDNHRGGCGSNRQAIHDYEQSIIGELNNINVNPNNTVFNGYSLAGKVYELR